MREPKELYVNFTFHPELCVGCGACVSACLDEHDNLPIEKPLLRRVYRTEEVRRGVLRLTWYSLACIHCAGHDCLDACPKSCFSLDAATGTVQLDNSGCIGCRACEKSCQYQGVVFGKDGKAAKCDGCLERLRAGLLPRCVEACPRRAITVDDRPAVRNAASKNLARALKTKSLKP